MSFFACPKSKEDETNGETEQVVVVVELNEQPPSGKRISTCQPHIKKDASVGSVSIALPSSLRSAVRFSRRSTISEPCSDRPLLVSFRPNWSLPLRRLTRRRGGRSADGRTNDRRARLSNVYGRSLGLY